MTTKAGRFYAVPHTQLGWWSVALGTLFTALFLLVVNRVIHFPGFLTMTLGVGAGIVTLIAIIGKKERSWLVWLMLVPGLFAILFALGEILVPH